MKLIGWLLVCALLFWGGLFACGANESCCAYLVGGRWAWPALVAGLVCTFVLLLVYFEGER